MWGLGEREEAVPLHDDRDNAGAGLADAEMGSADDDDKASAARFDGAKAATTEGKAGDTAQGFGYNGLGNTDREAGTKTAREAAGEGHYGSPIVSLPGLKKKWSSAGTSRGLSSR